MVQPLAALASAYVYWGSSIGAVGGGGGGGSGRLAIIQGVRGPWRRERTRRGGRGSSA